MAKGRRRELEGEEEGEELLLEAKKRDGVLLVVNPRFRSNPTSLLTYLLLLLLTILLTSIGPTTSCNFGRYLHRVRVIAH